MSKKLPPEDVAVLVKEHFREVLRDPLPDIKVTPGDGPRELKVQVTLPGRIHAVQVENFDLQFDEEKSSEEELLKAMIPVVEVLTRLIYEHHGAGCCMHIVTDDGNLEDVHVQHCLKSAYLSDHFHCMSLAALLLTIPEDMREDALQTPMGDRGD